MVKNGLVNAIKWIWMFSSTVLNFFPSKNSIKILPEKKSSLRALLARGPCWSVGKKAIFLKKMHFLCRKWHFLKNSFYSKFVSDQKYIIYCFKKNFFLLKLWFGNFHRIQPIYIFSLSNIQQRIWDGGRSDIGTSIGKSMILCLLEYFDLKCIKEQYRYYR